MKTLKCSLAVKVAAVVLFAVCLITAGLSGLGILFGYEGGVYTEGIRSFYQTRFADGIAYNFGTYQILDNYDNKYMTPDELEEYYSGDGCNFAFTLEEVRADGTETLVASTMDSQQTYGYTNTWNLSYSYGPSSEQTAYRITVAIKDPMPYHYGDAYLHARTFDLVSSMPKLLIVLLVGSILLGIADFVFLCCAAGHRKGSAGQEVKLNWVDRVPLDLYVFAAVLAIALLLNVSFEVGFHNLDLFANILGGLGLLASCLIALAVLLSFATRFKLGGWWRNTVIYRILAWLKRNGLWVWQMVLKACRALPMVWRTAILVGALLVILLFLGVTGAWEGFPLFLYFILSLVILAAACFASLQMKRIQKGGEDLAAGNFEAKIDTAKMYWDFKRHAENLNAIGDGMAIAVEQKMKSERLKTELITNVSHDIKTPLTSIINYVDLLQKAHTRDEEAQYLEVLQRQSARLKKLTEDLVEASKASTGNVSANLVQTNVVESINQALGEYEDRLAAGSLLVVKSFDAEDLSILADGRLLWRILDNLLGNVCKYALAGTRVYVTAAAEGGEVVLSIKNISRQQLNVSVEELMERFVRGDTARTTEGSGLGLNIARSLTELQRGKLHLVVDGDLFKAELRFPRCKRCVTE